MVYCDGKLRGPNDLAWLSSACDLDQIALENGRRVGIVSDSKGAIMSNVTDEDSLCSCGSGLKFKRCHGSIVDPAQSPGNLPLNATEFKAGLAGFPGQPQQLHVVNQYPDDDPRSSVPSQGAPGLYEVVFVLKRPGLPLVAERQVSFSSGLLGDSHLGICPPAFTPPGGEDVDRILLRSVGDAGQFDFIGTANQNGFLGKFTSRPIHARDRFHAEETAFRALAPSLSEFSLQLDIPLEIAQVETKDLTTENCM
jgi:SEC-C motif